MAAGSILHRDACPALAWRAHVGAAVVALLAACQAKGDAPAPVLEERGVTVRDPSGATVMDLQRTDAGCATGGAVIMTVARDGDRVIASGGTRLEMIPGEDGARITADGAARARVHRVADPLRVDLIDPVGVPLARIALGDGTATVVDPSRMPVARLRRDGGRIVVEDGGGAAIAYVHGTSDLEIAAHLVAPGVPAELRALLGCERLLALEPAPAKK